MTALAADGGFRVAVWSNFVQPTRMAFEGVAVLAPVAMIVVAVFVWVPHPPNRAVLALGGVGRLVGLAVTAAPHRSFERSDGN